jgi:hypothetical protein
VIRGVLFVHLICAALATGAFWTSAVTTKGGAIHRAAGRWFARFVYATALTGAVMALVRLVFAAGISPAERQTMWLVLYVLLIIVAPVQHGWAVVASAATPARVRSRLHAVLTLGAMLGSLAIIPAALMWGQWLFLIVGPLGLIIGLRQLKYATRRTASRSEWEREHLTSMIIAGVTLHTALLVFGTSRTLGLSLHGGLALLPWTVPALIGLPAVSWLRRTRRRPISD